MLSTLFRIFDFFYDKRYVFSILVEPIPVHSYVTLSIQFLQNTVITEEIFGNKKVIPCNLVVR